MRKSMAILVAAVLVGCAGDPDGVPGNSELSGILTGSVAYRERIELPPGAELSVELLDASAMDSAAMPLAEVSFVPEAEVPIPFELEYDPTGIDPFSSYELRATIRRGNNFLFVTRTPFPVLTNGAGESADLVLMRSGGGAAPVADASLTNTRWLLRTLGADSVRTGAGQRAAFLQLVPEADNSSVRGYSGCNNFTGSYRAVGSSLEFEGLVSTMRACLDMETESRFLAALRQTESYSIESTWLILSGPDAELATFEAWYE